MCRQVGKNFHLGVVLLALLVSIAVSRPRDPPNYRPEYGPTHQPYGYPPVNEKGKPYSYAYKVYDPYHGTDFGANEDSDGDQVQGSYNVVLPDGRKQTVKYTANHYAGYEAEVEFEGEPKHPPPSPYTPPLYEPLAPLPYYPPSPSAYNLPPTPKTYILSDPSTTTTKKEEQSIYPKTNEEKVISNVKETNQEEDIASEIPVEYETSKSNDEPEVSVELLKEPVLIDEPTSNETNAVNEEPVPIVDPVGSIDIIQNEDPYTIDPPVVNEIIESNELVSDENVVDGPSNDANLLIENYLANIELLRIEELLEVTEGYNYTEEPEITTYEPPEYSTS